MMQQPTQPKNNMRQVLLQSMDPSLMLGPIENVAEEEPWFPEELPAEIYQNMVMLAQQDDEWFPGKPLKFSFDEDTLLGGMDNEL
jgi:hypothetical protein